MKKRVLSLLCALALLLPAAVLSAAAEDKQEAPAELAEVETEEIELLPPGTEAETTENGWPAFPEEGEYILEDATNGVWEYRSPKLIVEIHRITETKPNKQIWYEAEVWCAEGGDYPRMIANDPENWEKIKFEEYPYKIARKNGVVLAVSSDFAHLRVQQKKTVGIVIRDSKIISSKTFKKSTTFPNLDCLAIWPDGNMAVYDYNEKTAEELLEAGVRDVLAFGPWLIRDGKLNEDALNKYGKSSAQRVAVGMVEKGHYFFMMLEGRRKKSAGAGISFLAKKLLEKGCTLAFNLDGGQTACIVFMGRQLCRIQDGGDISSRRTSDILGVGYSDQLPGVKDGWK